MSNLQSISFIEKVLGPAQKHISIVGNIYLNKRKVKDKNLHKEMIALGGVTLKKYKDNTADNMNAVIVDIFNLGGAEKTIFNYN